MYEKMSYQPYGSNNRYIVHFLSAYSQLQPISQLKQKRFLILYDNNLPINSVKSVVKIFDTKGNTIEKHGIQCGPKSLESATVLWKKMVDFVPDIVVGIGGGTISDLVGFTTGTYQRGIPDILFPTTILGMLDASLGGKTGIDFNGVKNCIGAIQYPKYVFNILEFLDTLPEKDFYAGLSEAVKAAVLFDIAFFESLENIAQKDTVFVDREALFSLLVRSSTLKMENSEKPTEYKIQLLYGHAVGHAIEILEHGALSHGEAVSIGMTIEGAIACLLGIWNIDEWKRQTKVLLNFHLPIRVPDKLDTSEITMKMELYKKLVKDDSLGFIFPEKLGVVHVQNGNSCTYISKNEWYSLFDKAKNLVKDIF